MARPPTDHPRPRLPPGHGPHHRYAGDGVLGSCHIGLSDLESLSGGLLEDIRGACGAVSDLCWDCCSAVYL